MQKKIIILLSMAVFLFCGCQRKDSDEILAQKLDATPQQRQRAKIESRIAANFEDADAQYELGKIFMRDKLLSRAEYQFSLAIGLDPVHRAAQAAHVKV